MYPFRVYGRNETHSTKDHTTQNSMTDKQIDTEASQTVDKYGIV